MYMKPVLLSVIFAVSPAVSQAQERSCIALQELLFAFVNTALAVSDHNQRMGEAAIAYQLTSGETEFSGLVQEQSQLVLSRLDEGANTATEIIQGSGCFEQ